MDTKTIVEFRAEVENMDIAQLQQKKNEIDAAISKMIMDSDLIIKAAIINSLIESKQNNG